MIILTRFVNKSNYILDTKTGKEYFYLSQCVSILNDLDSQIPKDEQKPKWKSAKDFFKAIK